MWDSRCRKLRAPADTKRDSGRRWTNIRSGMEGCGAIYRAIDMPISRRASGIRRACIRSKPALTASSPSATGILSADFPLASRPTAKFFFRPHRPPLTSAAREWLFMLMRFGYAQTNLGVGRSFSRLSAYRLATRAFARGGGQGVGRVAALGAGFIRRWTSRSRLRGWPPFLAG
jgi:hypothetical protein